MTAPLRTAGQFLEESGFGSTPDPLSFPEYPDLNTQLAALRKLDPLAREIPWVEYSLGRAREARLKDDPTQEAVELGNARKAIEESFKRRTPEAQWPKVLLLIAVIGLIGLLFWMEQRKKKRLGRRRQNVPGIEHDDAGDDNEDDDNDNEDEE